MNPITLADILTAQAITAVRVERAHDAEVAAMRAANDALRAELDVARRVARIADEEVSRLRAELGRGEGDARHDTPPAPTNRFAGSLNGQSIASDILG